MARPVLGDLELSQVQSVVVDEAPVLAVDRVPALDGDHVQTSGRRSTRLVLTGVLSGPEASAQLESLRAAYAAGQAVPFTADVTAATRLDEVVLEGITARELAGTVQRIEYALCLREHLPAPPPEQEASPPLPGPVDVAAAEEAVATTQSQVEGIATGSGSLLVQVDLGGGGRDHSGVVVRVEGESADGQPVSLWSDRQVDGVYTFPDMPAGSYSVRAELR